MRYAFFDKISQIRVVIGDQITILDFGNKEKVNTESCCALESKCV